MQVSRLKTSAKPLFEISLTHLLNNQLTNQITNSVEQSLSSESKTLQSKNSLHFMQPERSLLLYNSQSLVPILSQINPVRAHDRISWKSIFMLTLSPSISSKLSLSLRLTHQIRAGNHSHHQACSLPRPPHFSWFDPSNIFLWKVQIKFIFTLSPRVSCYLHNLSPR
jgi:hypothetical protein